MPLSISSNTNFCAVLGNPVAHSLSPLIHNRWYHDHAIDAVYLALPVATGKVKEVLNVMHNVSARGANITIPHKIEALQACSRLTERAKKIGATNSILFNDSEIIGDNTDSEGFARDLHVHQHAHFLPQKDFNKVCLWGAGGAAQAVLYALLNLQVREVLIINRTLAKAERLMGRMDKKISLQSVSCWREEQNFVASCDLFINASSQGMKSVKAEMKNDEKNTEQIENFFPNFSEVVKYPQEALAYDLVYNPVNTAFLQCAKKAKMKTAGGLGMLVAQAAISFENWFSVSPKISADFLESLATHINKN